MSDFVAVNKETGEEHQLAVKAPPKIPNGFGPEGWFAMSQALSSLYDNTDLHMADMRVLLLMLERMEYENRIHVGQSDIAKRLGMTRQQVSRAVKRLVQFKYLEECEKIGHTRIYKFNPQMGWRGKGLTHQRVLRQSRGLQLVKGGKE